MDRTAITSGLWVICAALVSMTPAPAAEGTKNRDAELRERLTRPVSFDGFEKDERFTLREALEQLNELFDVPFFVDEEAFRTAGLEDVLGTAIVQRQHLPKMSSVSLDTVLRRVLARIPAPSGTTYLVRRGQVEITTVRALREEIHGDGKRRLLPLVSTHLQGRLLYEALDLLAEGTGYSVVLDPRAGEKGKTPVTARFTNVPLDTAVRVLADMAGLKPVQVDNVLYVTTADNAQVLQKEHDKRTLEQSKKPDKPAN